MIDRRTGCGIAGLFSLPPLSVDLIFSDLPSGQTRAPFDKPLDLAAFWQAVDHAAHTRTAIVLMASCMRYAVEVVASNPHEFRYDLVWRKNKSTGFLNARRMPLRNHETLLVFYQALPVYHPQMRETGVPMHASTQTGFGENYGTKTRIYKTAGGSTLRHPRSVLPFAVVNGDAPDRTHTQQKPQALADWVIRSYTDPGALVVDVCAGSGSTLHAAKACGRHSIGWEIDTTCR